MIGNGEAKELICMTHGHEKRHEDCLREWGLLGGGRQRGGNQDNYNSITNKMQLKKRKQKMLWGKIKHRMVVGSVYVWNSLK